MRCEKFKVYYYGMAFFFKSEQRACKYDVCEKFKGQLSSSVNKYLRGNNRVVVAFERKLLQREFFALISNERRITNTPETKKLAGKKRKKKKKTLNFRLGQKVFYLFFYNCSGVWWSVWLNQTVCLVGKRRRTFQHHR